MKEIEVAIRKSVLPQLAAVKGHFDFNQSMVFVGFRGRLNTVLGLYCGVLVFEDVVMKRDGELPECSTDQIVFQRPTPGDLPGDEPEDTEILDSELEEEDE